MAHLQLGHAVDDDAGEGKPQRTIRPTPTTPPRQRRPEAPIYNAGAQIRGFPTLPPPRRPAEGEESHGYAGDRREEPSRLRSASGYCREGEVSRNGVEFYVSLEKASGLV